MYCRLIISALSLAVMGAAQATLQLEGLGPEAAGEAIVEHAEKQHAGWNSSAARSKLYMYDEQGTETVRDLKFYVIEDYKSSGDGRSYIIYDNMGTALMTYMNRDRSDVQWLWVPGLRKLKRLRMEGMNGAFVGSEFHYEDFRSQYPAKFHTRLLGESQIDTQPVWQIERIPRAQESAYSRLVVYIDQEHFRVLRTEFYDRNERLLKTLEAEDWQQHDGGFWRAMRSRMTNHLNRRVSLWQNEQIDLDIGLQTMQEFMR